MASREGFFHSTRRVKKGNPLSPSLFVLRADVLSRLLNQLLFINQFKGFSMSLQAFPITHLDYADDVVLFSSSNKKSLEAIIGQLQDYQRSSGQLINIDKSYFLISKNATINKI